MDNQAPGGADGDGLALRPIDRVVMDLATDRARANARHRFLLRYHDFPDLVQRMVNAVEPESYARPHRHANPPKVEVFVLLRGSGVVVRFDDAGEVLEATLVAAGGPTHGVEIPPGAWHSVVALESGTVFFEVKDGPYDAATDKEFAPWSPAEDDVAAAVRYLAALRERIGVPTLLNDVEDVDLDDDLP